MFCFAIFFIFDITSSRRKYMEKTRIILVEGPQGVGKTTLVEYLRENIAGCDLFRLSGIKDKTKTGLEKNKKRYNTLIDYISNCIGNGIDMVFDRSFASEQVYSSLGFKDYDFTAVFEELTKKFNALDADIYYFNLYIDNLDLYKKRIERDHHHGYIAFSKQNCINQQTAYKKVSDYLKTFSNIKVYDIAMDDFAKGYEQINKILNITLK